MSSGAQSEPARTEPRVAGVDPLVDPAVVSDCRRAPEAGPAIVFVSGGTALRELSRALKRLTYNSIHLITPFDSGGSSAPLRAAFGMPAVGDLRNRLLALADEDDPAWSGIQALFGHRLPRDEPPGVLRASLDDLIAGRDALLGEVPESLRRYARAELAGFAAGMPADFDLRGASVGNLILTAGYLADGRLGPTLARFEEELRVRGRVLPTVDVDLHLEARLADGRRVRGQHRITGKEEPPLSSPVADIRLIQSLEGEDGAPVRPEASREVRDLIRAADLLCYPMGSFYSSVLCNLLPAGIGGAVRDASCPKLYVPSTGRDPEFDGRGPTEGAVALLAALRADAGEDTPTASLVGGVLLDASPGAYPTPPDLEALDALGLVRRSTALVAPGRSEIDPERLAEILVTAARDPAAWRDASGARAALGR